MARTTVADQLIKIRKEREALEKREKLILGKAHSKGLAQITRIAKEYGLTLDDIAKALKSERSGTSRTGSKSVSRKSANPGRRAKVAPKYANPADPSQTWTGRGKAPLWAAHLKAAGILDSAKIS